MNIVHHNTLALWYEVLVLHSTLAYLICSEQGLSTKANHDNYTKHNEAMTTIKAGKHMHVFMFVHFGTLRLCPFIWCLKSKFNQTCNRGSILSFRGA